MFRVRNKGQITIDQRHCVAAKSVLKKSMCAKKIILFKIIIITEIDPPILLHQELLLMNRIMFLPQLLLPID